LHLNQRKYKRRAYTWEQIHLAQRGNPARDLVEVHLENEEGALVLTTLPRPVFAPAMQTTPAGGGRAVLAWHIRPGAAGLEHIQDTVQGASVVGTWPPPTGFLLGNQGGDDGPLCIG